MKSTNVIIIVLVVVLATAGVLYWLFIPELDDTELARRAMGGQGSVVCTYTDPDIEVPGELFIKDGMVRGEIETHLFAGLTDDLDAQATHFVVKGDVMYFWFEGQDQGLQISTDQEGVEGPLSDFEDEEQFAQEMEEQNIACERTSISDDFFDLPADVEFVDLMSFTSGFQGMPMEEDMEDFEQMMREMESFEGMEEFDEQELEQMMQELEAQFGTEAEMEMQMGQ